MMESLPKGLLVHALTEDCKLQESSGIPLKIQTMGIVLSRNARMW